MKRTTTVVQCNKYHPSHAERRLLVAVVSYCYNLADASNILSNVTRCSNIKDMEG